MREEVGPLLRLREHAEDVIDGYEAASGGVRAGDVDAEAGELGEGAFRGVGVGGDGGDVAACFVRGCHGERKSMEIGSYLDGCLWWY